MASACEMKGDEQFMNGHSKPYTFDQAGLDTMYQLSQTGDIVFRNGIDEVSQAARMLSRRDPSYSHCGIVIREGDTAYVYHSIGGTENPSGRLKRQPLVEFFDTMAYSAFAIYRLKTKEDILPMVSQVVHRHFRNGLRFDAFFNLQSDDVMYCSEFVAKSMNEAFEMAGMKVKFMAFDKTGVTIDDISLNPFCRFIRKEVAYVNHHSHNH